MKDFSVIIPHRGPTLGLWATIHSIEVDLAQTRSDYGYVIVTNGEKATPELSEHIALLQKAGKLSAHIHSESPLSPPVARQRGAEVAGGKLLFFFDNHCIVQPRYFDRALLDFEDGSVDSLRSTVCFSVGGPNNYHYRLKLAHNFWAEYSQQASSHKAYKAAAAGHGAFAIRKSVWDSVGGYGPETLLDGYGGEEMLLDLKLWRYGFANHVDPKLVHYHYAGQRGYSRHFTDEYYRNLMVSANVIGGAPWLEKVFVSLATKGKHLRVSPQKSMFELMQDAHSRSADYALHVDRKSVVSLDELLEQFREAQVATQ